MRPVDPYSVLGVSFGASLEEIEAAYRSQVREHHPDLHYADGPDAIAAAEQRTRVLTEAMAQIRAEASGATVAPPGAWRTGTRTPPPPRRPVRPPADAICPYCGATFGLMRDFSAHLDAAHQLHQRQFGGSNRPTGATADAIDAVGKARFLPAWLVTLVFLVAFIGAFDYPIVWGPLSILLLVVLWTQTSPTFRQRR